MSKIFRIFVGFLEKRGDTLDMLSIKPRANLVEVGRISESYVKQGATAEKAKERQPRQ